MIGIGTPSSQSKIPRPILVLPGIGLKAPRYEKLSVAVRKDSPQTLEQTLCRLRQPGRRLVYQRSLRVAASSTPLITVALTAPDGPWPQLRE